MKEGRSKSIDFLTDALGSVRDIIGYNQTTMQWEVIQQYEFDARGNHLISPLGGGPASPKTFVGGLSVNDDTGDSGLYLMGHRFYDPTLGRFLNRDPIGFRGGYNLFEFGNNNPVTYTDHTGLEPDIRRFDSYEAQVFSDALGLIKRAGFGREAVQLANLERKGRIVVDLDLGRDPDETGTQAYTDWPCEDRLIHIHPKTLAKDPPGVLKRRSKRPDLVARNRLTMATLFAAVIFHELYHWNFGKYDTSKEKWTGEFETPAYEAERVFLSALIRREKDPSRKSIIRKAAFSREADAINNEFLEGPPMFKD